jgi:hypothetical protein
MRHSDRGSQHLFRFGKFEIVNDVDQEQRGFIFVRRVPMKAQISCRHWSRPSVRRQARDWICSVVERCRPNVEHSPVILHDKLFTPGPVEVSEKTLAAFSRPMIGHRGEDFKALYRSIHPRLQELFGTQQPVFLSTSSAWGVMEGAIRNLVRQRVLCCMCGAFSDKWLEVARRCGKEAEPLQVEWGQAIDHKAVDARLASGKFDTITLIHN